MKTRGFDGCIFCTIGIGKITQKGGHNLLQSRHFIATLAVVSLVSSFWMAGASAAVQTKHPIVVKSTTHNKSKPSGVITYLQPMALSITKSLEKDTVYNSKGKVVKLPTSTPVLFAAWWCPHCHEALQQIKTDHDLNKINVVSVYINGDTTKPVTTWRQALTLTEKGLREAGVSIPLSHLFVTLPTNRVNRQITGVPQLWKFSGKQAHSMIGTPNSASVWEHVL